MFIKLKLLSFFLLSFVLYSYGTELNIDRLGEEGELLYGPMAPQQGRSTVISYHQGYLYTVPEVPDSIPVTLNGVLMPADHDIRQWDISNPENPIEMRNLGQTTHPMQAHGHMESGEWQIFGGLIFKDAGNGDGSLIYNSNGLAASEIGTNWYGGRNGAYPPFNLPHYWSYGDTSHFAEVRRMGEPLWSRWDHIGLTGVIGQSVLLGNQLIVMSDQSVTGLVIYDLSPFMDGNPDNDAQYFETGPPILGIQKEGAFGGYWPDVYGDGGRLYAVAPYRKSGNGLRLVEITDPTNPGSVIDIDLEDPEQSSSMYAQFQDHYAFTGGAKVDMRTFKKVLQFPTRTVAHRDGSQTANDEMGISASQFLMPLGNLLITGGGGGENQGTAIWVHQEEKDEKGPTVGYHIPRAGHENYPVAAPISLIIHETLDTTTIVNKETFYVRPVDGDGIDDRIEGSLFFAYNDVLTFTPFEALSANTTFEVVLTQGGIEDAVGNGIESEYRFTFSTGDLVGGNNPPVIDAVNLTGTPAAPGESVGFEVFASDPDEGDNLQYRFSFGDGTDQTDWSVGNTINHTFETQGHFRVLVQVRDGDGVVGTTTVVATVLHAPPENLPVKSSQIVHDEAVNVYYVLNPDNDSIAMLSADPSVEDKLLSIIQLPAGTDPRSISQDALGRLWVTGYDSDRLYVVNPENEDLDVVDLSYGSAPFGVVLSPDLTVGYVSLFGSGRLLKFDPNALIIDEDVITDSIQLEHSARGISINGDHSRIFVTRFLSGDDLGLIWDITADTFTLRRTFVLSPSVITDTSAQGAGIYNYLSNFSIQPNGEMGWVTAVKANTKRGIQRGDGATVDADNTLRTVILPVDLVENSVLRDEEIDLDNMDSAVDIVFSPSGDYGFITAQGNNAVVLIDMLTLEERDGLGSMIGRLNVGAAPQGLLMDSVNQQVVVKNFMGRSISLFDLTPLFMNGSASISAVEYDTLGDTSDALDSTVLKGKELFYHAGSSEDFRMSSEGYISCASCHIDGSHDAQTWDFTHRGEGLRNTIDLRGRAGMAHGNVHWTANFDEIHDFENDIRFHFGGTGFMSDEDFENSINTLGNSKAGKSVDLDALVAYVESLGEETYPRSPYREADTGAMTDEALVGQALFHDQNCASCHDSSTNYVDGKIHNVGTLKSPTSGQRLGAPLLGVETPTLLGLWETPSYFHDGSARRLEDVFHLAGGIWYEAEDADLINVSARSGGSGVLYFGGSGVNLKESGEQIIWDGVDGGDGGLGALTFRFNTPWSTRESYFLSLTVNGVVYPVEMNGDDPQNSQYFLWIVDEIPLLAGLENTIVLEADVLAYDNVSYDPQRVTIDSMLVSTANDLLEAEDHRKVNNLNISDRNALIAYLLQLDGQDAMPDTQVEFDLELPLTPSDLNAEAFSATKLNYRYKDNSVSEDEFILEYRTSGLSSEWIDVSLSSQSGADRWVEGSLVGLEPSTEYELRVKAKNKTGYSETSEIVVATTMPLETGRLFTYAGESPFLYKDKLSIKGNGSILDEHIILFPRMNHQETDLWYEDRVPIAAFETEFVVQQTGYRVFDGNPALFDSRIYFVLQSQSAEILTNGNPSNNLSDPKFALEFRLVNGPAAKVESQLNGETLTDGLIGSRNLAIRMDDGDPHRVRIAYVGGNTDQFEVWVTNEVTGIQYYNRWKLDIDGTLGADAFVGITGDSQFSIMDFDLKEWLFNDLTNQALADQTPSSPANISLEVVSDRRVDVYFVDQSNFEFGFNVYHRLANSEEPWTKIVRKYHSGAGETIGLKVEGLLPLTEYEFKASAENILGESQFSGTATITTLSEGTKLRKGFYAENLEVPGLIRVGDFDVGGNEVSYYDDSMGNSGDYYRLDDDVDLIERSNSRIDAVSLDKTQEGEWLEYTVDVEEGLYDVEIRYESAGASVDDLLPLRLFIGESLVADVVLPGFNGYNKSVDAVVPGVSLDEQTGARLRVELGANNMRLSEIRFVPVLSDTIAYATPELLSVVSGSPSSNSTPFSLSLLDHASGEEEYEVWYRRKDDSIDEADVVWWKYRVNANAKKARIPDLSNGEEFVFKVRAVGEAGVSLFSDEEGGTTGQAQDYIAWANMNDFFFTPEISSLWNSDPDFDGLINLLEYAMDLDPKQDRDARRATSAELNEINGQRYHEFTYRSNTQANDIEIHIERSLDRYLWEKIAVDDVDTIEAIIDPDPDEDQSSEIKKISFPAEDFYENYAYLRLHIILDGVNHAYSWPVLSGAFHIPLEQSFSSWTPGLLGKRGSFLGSSQVFVSDSANPFLEGMGEEARVGYAINDTNKETVIIEFDLKTNGVPVGAVPSVSVYQDYAFYIDEEGSLFARDGEDWVDVTQSPLNLDLWHRIRVELYYWEENNDPVKTWNLSINGAQWVFDHDFANLYPSSFNRFEIKPSASWATDNWVITYPEAVNPVEETQGEIIIDEEIFDSTEGYNYWKNKIGLTSGLNDGYQDDPDGDGLMNLMEYTFGYHPQIFNENPISFYLTEDETIFEIIGKSDELPFGVSMEIETSNDFSNWRKASFSETLETGEVDAFLWRFRRENTEVSEAVELFRLKVFMGDL